MTLYQLQLKYGGRHADDFTGKINVKRERLDRQGYASDGSYFGVGAPVFRVFDAESDGGDVEFYVRSWDADTVREKVSEAYPGAAKKARRR